MPMGKERTREELYREAERLNIKGRSKMNKGALKAALARGGHYSSDPLATGSCRAESRAFPPRPLQQAQ